MSSREQELWFPADRLIPILARIVNHEVYPMTLKRRIWGILNGEVEFVSLGALDNLLVTVGLDDWLRVPADQGGLADIYQDGVQYGQPDRRSFKYRTPEEREAAVERRRTYQRNWARSRAAA